MRHGRRMFGTEVTGELRFELTHGLPGLAIPVVGRRLGDISNF